MKRPATVHEDFSRVVEGTAALGLLALWPLVRHRPVRAWAFVLGVMVLVPALLRPQLLGPANRRWFRLGLLMQRLVPPAVMALRQQF